MQSSICLNIPLPSSRREGDEPYHRTFLSVDENNIIYPAGNSLQITPILPSAENCNRSNGSISLEGIRKVAQSDHGRGFSCFCFNNQLRRIAFSPRDTNPSIFVWSHQRNKMLCKIEEGAKLEYADISFNSTGNKLVAIGKGEIDANVFIWTFTKEPEQYENMSKLPFKAKLLLKKQLSCVATQCLFNPVDDNKIAFLCQDRELISVCKLTELIGKVQCQESLFTIEQEGYVGLNRTISTFIWEKDHKLLVGMSDSSIYSISELGEEKKIWSSSQDMDLGEVSGIKLTRLYVIVVFRNGKLVWVHRKDHTQGSTVDVYKELSVDDEIIAIDCDPLYKNVLVLTKNGSLIQIPVVHRNDNKNDDSNLLTCSKIAEIHHCLISSVCTVTLSGKASVALVLFGGFDGRVKAYRDSQIFTSQYVLPSSLASIDIGSPVTSLETLRGNPVCAVGSSDGYLRFVHLGKSKEHKETFGEGSVNLIVLKSEVLTNAPITSLKFSPATKKLVAVCYESGQAFIICAEPTNLHVLGIVETVNKSPICSTSWSNKTDFYLFIGSKNGYLACYDTSSMCFSPEPLKPVWKVNAQIQCAKGIVIAEHGDVLVTNIAHTDIDGFASFIIKQEKEGEMKMYLNQRNDSFKKIVSFMSVESGLLLVGSMSGEVKLFEYSNEGTFVVKSAAHAHSCPILSITISSDHSRVYSTSVDGAIFVSVIGAPLVVTPSAYEYDYLLPKNPKRKIVAIDTLDTKLCDESGRRMTWMFKATKQLNDEAEREAAGTKKIIRERIDGMREKFQKILLENKALDEETRLRDEELVIDLTEDRVQRDKINSIVQSYANKVNRQIDKDNEALKRIKSLHIENRESKFHRMFSVLHSSDPFSVINFPIKSLNDEEERVLMIIISLRKNELTEIQRNKMRASQNGMCWSTYLQNSLNGTPWSLSIDIRDCFHQLTSSCTDKDEHVTFDASQSGEFESYRLLYPLLSIRTKSQRITQVHLVRNATRDLMTTYNQKFMTVQSEKKVIMDQVHVNLKRINEIAEDLDMVSILKKHKIIDDIIPDSYDCIDTHCTEKSTEQRQLTISPNSKRGLEHIMDMKLDVAMVMGDDDADTADSLLINDVSLNNKHINEPTEQNKIGKDLKLLQRNEQLSKELKRLETDVHSLSKGLNEQLSNLDRDYNLVREVQRSNELYSIYLAKSMVQDIDLQRLISELEVEKDSQIRAQEQFYNDDYKNVKEEYDNQRKDLLQKMNYDKALDKNFRKSMLRVSGEVIDQETLNILYHLFQKRHDDENVAISSRAKQKSNGRMPPLTKRSKIGRQSGRDSTCSINKNKRNSEISTESDESSNFVHKMKQAISEANSIYDNEEEFHSVDEPFSYGGKLYKQKTEVTIEEPTISDVPEGFVISDSAWTSMLQLRKSKLLSEMEVRSASDLITKTKNMVEYVEKIEREFVSSIADLENRIKELQRKKRIEMKSSCILFHAKQGQIKAQDSSHEDIILVPERSVSALNDKIQTLVNDKMKIQKKIGDLRGEIKKIDCKNELLKLKEANEKELYIDFQMMHLSNELKYMLNGETNDTKKLQESLLEDQLSSKMNLYDRKLKKLNYEQNMLNRTIKERSDENMKLEKQLDALRNAVKVREDNGKMKTSDQDSDAKMKIIIQRSKLSETVRNQSAEICRLRTELDKLRQATFPSFAS